MGAKFDLGALMGAEVSKLDTFVVEMIPLADIDLNEKNFFTVGDVDDLIESIEVNGLLQPLVVRQVGTRYRLIAGHRRLKAVTALYERDAAVQWSAVPCKVVNPASDELEELMLITTNATARELGWGEKTKAIERTEAILVKLQEEQGVTLPGKMRETVAKILKISESQIARAKVIEKGLIPKFKERVGGHVSEDTAYKLAQLDAADQEELYERKYKARGYIQSSDVAAYKKAIKEGRDPFAPAPKELKRCYAVPSKKGAYVNCPHEAFMAERAGDEAVPEEQRCPISSSLQCCARCGQHLDCDSVCERYMLKVAAAENDWEVVYARRLKSFRERLGLSREEALERVPVSRSDGGTFGHWENGQWLSLSPTIEICGALGCSADYLLGLSDSPERGAGVWQSVSDNPPPDGVLVLAASYSQGLGAWKAAQRTLSGGQWGAISADGEFLAMPECEPQYWAPLPGGAVIG